MYDNGFPHALAFALSTHYTDGVTGTFIPYFKMIGQRILPPKNVAQLRYTKSVIVLAS